MERAAIARQRTPVRSSGTGHNCLALRGGGFLVRRPSLSILGSGMKREFGVAAIAALCLAAVLVVAHLCSRPGHIALLLRAATCAGLIVSIYGIAQYFDLDPFQSSQGYHALDGDAVIVRPPGTFGHADYFGWWLAIDFFCALAVVRGDGRIWRMLGIATACLTAVGYGAFRHTIGDARDCDGERCAFRHAGCRIRGKQVVTAAAIAALTIVFVDFAIGRTSPCPHCLDGTRTHSVAHARHFGGIPFGWPQLSL